MLVKNLEKLNICTAVWTVVTGLSATVYYLYHPQDTKTFFQIIILLVLCNVAVLGINLKNKIKKKDKK